MMRLGIAILFLGLVCLACDDQAPSGVDAGTGADAKEVLVPETSGVKPDAKPKAVSKKGVSGKVGGLDAPERYQKLVPRLGYPVGTLYGDMCYEGNNLVMRGPKNKHDRYDVSGEDVASRWKKASGKLSCVFVLRDSLFSQQDHPWRQKPYAIMLPPSWITAAADVAHRKGRLKPMKTYQPENDRAWQKIKSMEELFGSFPPSETLFTLAVKDRQKVRVSERDSILNARHTLRMLADDVTAMIRHEGFGAKGLAAVGALRIRDSDRRYFGEAARRDVIVPILVENPTPEEIKEGKGLVPAGRDDIAPEVVALVRKEIYRRRLEDGDIAIERYDISRPEERKRAIALLETLIPKGSVGAKVWLWVTGPLDPKAKLKGEDGVRWIGSLRLELEKSKVEMSRLSIINKPSVVIPKKKGRVEAFDQAVTRFNALDLPLSVNLNTRSLQHLIKQTEEKRAR